MRGIVAIALLLLALPAPALAQQQSDPNCLNTDPPQITRPPQPLRFGITPGAAGTVGATQGAVAPEDPGRAVAALQQLRPDGKALVMRLNRLFWADGDEGVRRFAELTDRYAAAGFEVESQVRYHPPPGGEGDIAAWEQYVRAVVRELGRRQALTALTITNEGNYDGSRNTSDGAYAGVLDALVRGMVVAREELDAMGRGDVRLGFSVMWRWRPDTDRRFWEQLGGKADAEPAFRPALDYVGLQIYPGLVWPPAPMPGRTAGDEIVEGLTLLRSCYMPKAKLGPEIAVWVSENGYATNLGRSEQTQLADLTSTLDQAHRYSGELGLTDYRYFNLRDNDSDGEDLFDAVGLLRDDYTPKPAFDLLRTAVAERGAQAPPPPEPAPRPTLRPSPAGLRVRVVRRRRGIVVRGRVLGSRCRGTVRVRVARRVRRARVRANCRFRLRVRRAGRGVRVAVRRGTVLVVRRV